MAKLTLQQTLDKSLKTAKQYVDNELAKKADTHDHNYLPTAGGTATGNIILYNSTNGDSPALIFQRGTTNDAYTDWRLQDRSGSLYFDKRVSDGSFSNAIIFNENGTISATGGFNGNATSASKVNNNMIVKLNGGSTEDTNLFTFNGSTAKTVNITPSAIGAASSNYYKNNAKVITVEGDANTYYPVVFGVDRSGNPYIHLNISRGYGDTAPSTWYTSTHKGGLTLSIRWSGDVSWGGNDRDVRVDEFNETYCTMVAGLSLCTTGMVVWLRGGTANYVISSEYGSGITTNIYYQSYTDGNSAVFEPRTNTDNVNEEIKKRWTNRYSGELYDRGNRVYSASNKPTPADIGAAAASHGHSNMVQGDNTSRTTNQNGNANDLAASGFYRVSSTNSTSNPLPDGMHAHILHGQHPSMSYAYQIAVPYSSTNKLYFRNNPNDSWGSWNKIYHSGDKPTAADIGAIATTGGNVTGNLTLYNSSSGDTPGLVFQRGTTSDSYYDWKIHDSSGVLYFGVKTNSNSDFDKKISMSENGVVTATTFSGTATNSNKVGGYSVWVGTQAQYDAISSKSSTTIYYITG